jgi:putative aldouronate transport system substrate-binding protein
MIFRYSSILGAVPPENGKGLQMIDDKFNINFKPEIVPYDTYGTKLPIVISTNQIPDITGLDQVDQNYYNWSKQGAFLPLDDYIKNDPTLKDVPDFVWDQLKVDGHIYSIPQYFPIKYLKLPVIRQDWLDKLKLPMPTNFAELEKVAVAFTTQDPDGNGKADTYGIGLANGLLPSYDFGPYWSSAWYNTNDKGQVLPATLSKGAQEHLQFFANVNKDGAVDKDWPLKKIGDVKKEFYAGKFGIYWEQPYGLPEKYFTALAGISPDANVVPIPPFIAPDGSQGIVAGSGYYQMYALSGKLKDDPDKVKRILELLGYFRTFIPFDQRTPSNVDADWQAGLNGQGYSVENGIMVNKDAAEGLAPQNYLETRYWAPNDEANEIAKSVIEPHQKAFFTKTEELLKNTKAYYDPTLRVHSEVVSAKDSELWQLSIDESTKMVLNNSVASDWAKFVQTYLNKGGQEEIDDVNRLLTDSGVKGEWK